MSLVFGTGYIFCLTSYYTHVHCHSNNAHFLYADMFYRYTILEVMAFFAVLSNSAIVAFTGNYTLNYTWVVRVWIFVCMAAGIMGVKLLIAAIVPDEPHEVTIQLKRAEYLTNKFFDDIVDEDDSDLLQTVASNVDYCVKETDDDPL